MLAKGTSSPQIRSIRNTLQCKHGCSFFFFIETDYFIDCLSFYKEINTFNSYVLGIMLSHSTLAILTDLNEFLCGLLCLCLPLQEGTVTDG